MALITNPDGSHRFVQDPGMTSSFDIESLVQARARPSVGQQLRPGEWNVQPVPGYAGVSYFQLVLGGEGRGGYRQAGTFDQALTDFSEQDLCYDDYEIARLPFIIQGTSRVNSDLGGRMCGAHFLNRSLIMSAQAAPIQLWEDNGAFYEANFTTVAGFTTPAGALLPTCMRQGNYNGAPALFIGYLAANISTLQMVTALSPFASVPVLNNQRATWGVVQTPVDGDSIQIYLTDDADQQTRVKTVNTNFGTGAPTFRNGVNLPYGGYTVGLVNLDGNPEVFYVGSANGYTLLNSASGNGYDLPLFRGKLLRVDLRALTVFPVATALSFVLYVTAGDNNDGTGAHDLFYCNGTDHQYMTHGADIPVLPSADRPQLPANYKRWCGGHWYKDGRFYWEENIYDATFASGTFVRRYEFDPAMGRYGVRPVTRVMDFSPQKGITGIGGPNLPWSVTNNQMISGSRSEWVAQYVPHRSETGYSKRYVDGANAFSGPRYEASGYRRWPRLRPPGKPGAVMALARVTGPPPANLRTGSATQPGMDFHNTRVEVSEAHTLPVATFYGDDGVDELGMSRWRPAVDFPDNDSWTDELDITITAYRDTGGGIFGYFCTPNPGPIVVEGYMREMGAPPPSRNILNWGADRIAADDLSRPLL